MEKILQWKTKHDLKKEAVFFESMSLLKGHHLKTRDDPPLILSIIPLI